jgi:hypothetical protein
MKHGRIVKGIKFGNLRDARDLVEVDGFKAEISVGDAAPLWIHQRSSSGAR